MDLRDTNMTGSYLDREDEKEAVLFGDSRAPVLENSEIKKFFSETSIFITGGTGFMGKVLIEKLLRVCSDLNRMYILVRPKKGKEIGARLEEQFNDPLYELLKKVQPNFMTKITAIAGDVGCIDLGMSPEDRTTIINEVNVIFHVAATVRFDEKIKTAVAVNVRGTRDVFRLAKAAQNIKSVIHISTAYSNCIIKEIDEKFYDSPIPWEKLVDMIESLDEDLLNRMTPSLLGEYPNTYAYTKAVGESVVKEMSKGLPVAMVRPAIVISTAKEPIVGWIDNVYGATGVVLGAALGLIHSLHADSSNVADMIPVDYVINATIAAAWYTGTSQLKCNDENLNEPKSNGKTEPPSENVCIYNYVSSEQMPITWGEFMTMNEKYAPTVPSDKILWSYCFTLNKIKFVHMMYVFFLHTIPSYLVDGVLYCLGKQPMLVKGYQKINKFSGVISYFSTQKWKFSNINTQNLFNILNKDDKEFFDFDMNNLHWDTYFMMYVRGLRLYLLKDPLDTLPQGAKKVFRMKVLHNTLCIVLTFLLLKLLWSGYLFVCKFI